MRHRALIGSLILALGLSSCTKDPEVGVLADEPFNPELPTGAPPLPIPLGAELTVARVQLGKALFFDPALSLGNGVSCAHCHFPDHAFSDTVALSAGAFGRMGFRNSPSLGNVAWQTALFHDGGVPTLELQVLAPLHAEDEMASDLVAAAAQLRQVEPYASLSLKAYARELDGFVITRALAAYERTLISGWSRFDRFLYQAETGALTAQEQEGWTLFQSTGCAQCHSGWNFTDNSYRNVGSETDLAEDPGRERITLDPQDRGAFKVPGLRNVALTAPYMHDGSLATLADVLDHFNVGGDNSQPQDPLMQALGLSASEREAIIAFLNSLTDQRPLDQVP